MPPMPFEHLDAPGSEAPADSPRYCPSCRARGERDDGRGLCDSCGETLVEQGYCEICEDYWLLPVGADCPKHDVPLGERVEPAGWPGEGSAGAAGRLVTLARLPDVVRAEALRIRLEAEGIPVFLQGSRMGGLAMYQVATGGVALQVPEALAADARVVLSQTWTPPADDEDLDDAWEELAPEPGARRRRVMKWLILVFLFGPLVLALLNKVFRIGE